MADEQAASSSTPISDALERIGTGGDRLDVEIEHGQTDTRIEVEARKDFGRPGGWTGGAAAGWTKRAGAFVAAVLSWRPGGGR